MIVAIERFRTVALVLALAWVLLGCTEADYPYFVRATASNLKPVFIILVDQSGSNSANLAEVNAAVEQSKRYMLRNLYDGDAESMAQRLFVGGYPNGENWADALMAAPSELIRDVPPEVDADPNRIILFYGNGGGSPGTVQARATEFIANELVNLDFYLARLLITPGADVNYTAWAQCAIDSGSYCTDLGWPVFEPPMRSINWDYAQYDPLTDMLQLLLEDIVAAVVASL